ncbi:Serine/threonine-protein kinase ksg1 [Sphaceloma murrayae]|uniref:Serine/threonine-protein kinase ksg1 n=1 Tax=Sphaceloma murrayae TaxID=2082308 RepID=A0A2K1QSQ5_9PEZI|nr:Serine/threonine-protein kinase ksg1 [Sphaceloma murrayae]
MIAPRGALVGIGSNAVVVIARNDCVLKRPLRSHKFDLLYMEHQLLEIMSEHPDIIQSRGLTAEGLLLERALNGDLRSYLDDHPATTEAQRRKWCLELTQAVKQDNLLLDHKLTLKLADFQGQLLTKTGEVALDALAVESARHWLPRMPRDHASVRSELFALGSTIHFIMSGKPVFADLGDDPDDEIVSERFIEGYDPGDVHIFSRVVKKCWEQRYLCAEEVIRDLDRLCNSMDLVDHEASDEEIMGLCKCKGSEVAVEPLEVRCLMIGRPER